MVWPQWPKPESAVSSNMPVDNEYSGYNPEGESCVWMHLLMVIDIFANILIILYFLLENL